MEANLELLKSIGILLGGVIVFSVLFTIWMIPPTMAKMKQMNESTKMIIWVLLVLSLFCPLFWLLALLIAYACDK